MFSYVFLSNYLASQQYAVATLKTELHQQTVALELVTAELENRHSLAALSAFAHLAGMVEAKDVSHLIYSEKNLAGPRLTAIIK